MVMMNYENNIDTIKEDLKLNKLIKIKNKTPIELSIKFDSLLESIERSIIMPEVISSIINSKLYDTSLVRKSRAFNRIIEKNRGLFLSNCKLFEAYINLTDEKEKLKIVSFYRELKGMFHIEKLAKTRNCEISYFLDNYYKQRRPDLELFIKEVTSLIKCKDVYVKYLIIKEYIDKSGFKFSEEELMICFENEGYDYKTLSSMLELPTKNSENIFKNHIIPFIEIDESNFENDMKVLKYLISRIKYTDTMKYIIKDTINLKLRNKKISTADVVISKSKYQYIKVLGQVRYTRITKIVDRIRGKIVNHELDLSHEVFKLNEKIKEGTNPRLVTERLLQEYPELRPFF